MSETTPNLTGAAAAAAPRQSAATAAESGLPLTTPVEKSAREKELEQQLATATRGRDDYKRKRDEVKQQLEAQTERADKAERRVLELEELLANKEAGPDADATVADAEQADEHADVRELLTRYNLERAWKHTSGAVYFDENAAQAAAGGDADSLILIEPLNG